MSSSREYVAVYGFTGNNWCARFPDGPGILVTGDTLDETRGSMREALRGYLEGLEAEGAPAPTPQLSFSEVIQV